MKPYVLLTTILVSEICNSAYAISIIDNLIATTDSKNFSTPGYPIIPYPNDASCEWRIQAPLNRFVVVTFLEGNTESCCDQITVMEGTDVIGQFSGFIPPGTSRISSSNSLQIIFSSDDSITFSGFLAHYQIATCGRNIPINTTTPAEFTSAGWPRNYFNNQKCFWILYGVEGKQIDLNLLEGTIAQNDYIEVFDGLSSFGRRSGALQDAFTSTNGILTLTFKSDARGTDQGFRAEYKQKSCGFNANVDNIPMEISTPQYPRFYPINLECEWNLSAAAGRKIEIIFIGGDTEDCCDSIQLFEGNVLFRKLSGNIVPGSSITSISNNLRITFVSDSSGTAPGFRALFREVDPFATCGGVLTVSDAPKIFSSPLYPFIYENDLSCLWTLQAEDQRTIMLTFLVGSTQKCCDIIQVADQNQDLLTLSGNIENSTSVTSTSNTLTVRFSSDSSIADSGFLASFQQVTVATTMPTTASESTTKPTTSSTSESTPISITTLPATTLPATPESTTTSTQPSTTFEVTTIPMTTSTITSTSTTISTTTSSMTSTTASTTVLETTSEETSVTSTTTPSTTSKSTTATTIASSITPDTTTTTTTTEPPTTAAVTSARPTVLETTSEETSVTSTTTPSTTSKSTTATTIASSITPDTTTTTTTTEPPTSAAVTSARPIVQRGIDQANTSTKAAESSTTTRSNSVIASTTAELPVCESTMEFSVQNSISYISTHSYPSYYSNNLHCIWILQADRYMKILIIFLEGETEEVYDEIEVFDGVRSILTLSGKITPGTSRISSGNRMRITFTSDSELIKPGFSASYEEARCGDNWKASFTRRQQSIRIGYIHASDCFWIVYSREQYQIQLTFIWALIDQNDFIEIFDGISSLGYVSSRNRVFLSTKGSLRMHFHSGNGYHVSHFIISYRELCRRNFTALATPTYLNSPNWPSDYPNNLECVWYIFAPILSKVVLTIKELDVERGYDYLQIERGDDRFIRLHRVFSSTDFWSTNGLIRLTFKTDGNTQRRGFRASFVTSKCETHLTANNLPAELTSPNWPNNYGNNINCTWIIYAGDEEKLVRLQLDEIFLPECCDYVEVFADEQWIRLNNFTSTSFSSEVGGNLMVRFVSDNEGTDKGFLMTYNYEEYQSETLACQSQNRIYVESATKNISTYLYPTFYANDLFCDWLFETTQDRKILLTFLEGQTQKLSDYIEVFDGERNILTLSGHIVPGITIISNSSTLRVTFTSDSSIVNRGFLASVQKIACGSSKEASSLSKVISLRSSGYLPNHNCYWIIHARWLNQVQLKFSTVYLRSTEFIEVFDGDLLIDRIRKSFFDFNFISSKGFLKVKFNAMTWSHLLPSLGLTSKWEAVYKEICGQNFTASERPIYVTSPNWPNDYPNHLECEWYISALPSKKIVLTIEEINIEGETDVLAIQEGNVYMAVLSDTSSNYEYRSNTRLLRLLFRSYQFPFGRGFRASFVQYP